MEASILGKVDTPDLFITLRNLSESWLDLYNCMLLGQALSLLQTSKS